MDRPVTPVCRVWWSVPGEITPGDLAVLDRAEHRRLAGTQRPGNRERFVRAAVLLRRLVAAETGVAPAQVVVERTCAGCGHPHGRPRLPGLDLHASITHSADRVGVALTAAGPVGLDVERVVPRDIDRFAPRVLAEDENAAGLDDFYRYWTRKESVAKATGAGVTVGLRRVRVSAPDQPPRLRSYPGMVDPVACMHDLGPGAGYRAAVTVLGIVAGTVDEHWIPQQGSAGPERRPVGGGRIADDERPLPAGRE